MNKKEEDFYKNLRIKINKWLDEKVGRNHPWSEYILLAPDLFHLLTKLVVDSDVPDTKKIKIAASILYFISPIDFLPEALLGPVGYLDDVALAAYILNDIINNVDPVIVSRHWAGEKDILALVKTILANADKFLGTGIWKKIKNKFK